MPRPPRRRTEVHVPPPLDAPPAAPAARTVEEGVLEMAEKAKETDKLRQENQELREELDFVCKEVADLQRSFKDATKHTSVITELDLRILRENFCKVEFSRRHSDGSYRVEISSQRYSALRKPIKALSLLEALEEMRRRLSPPEGAPAKPSPPPDEAEDD